MGRYQTIVVAANESTAASHRIPVDTNEPGGRRTLWRSWLLVPEWRPGRAAVPLLTGLHGFPWRQAQMQARCTQNDPAPGEFPFSIGRVDRYHPVVPHPGCSCGIYATTEPSRSQLLLLPPHPLVTGFVELSGRLIQSGPESRAQLARIVGPLTLGPMPRSRLRGRIRDDSTVLTAPDRYVLYRRPGRKRQPYGEWKTETVAALQARYGAEVISLDRAALR